MATLPNIYNGNTQRIAKPFLPAKTASPQCGFVMNMYYTNGKLQEATLNVAGIISSMAVQTMDDTVPTSGTYAGGNLSPKAIRVAKKATTVDEVAAFVLETESDAIPVEGGASVPLPGSFVKVALIGSKIWMYLPCDNTLVGVATNSKVGYDLTNSVLTIGTTTNDIGVRIVGNVVDGKVKKINATSGLAEWTDTKCILVEI